MEKCDLEAAGRFIAADARVLDRRRFERAFRGGAAQPVRDALAAYRNPDGGFGHALEPDGRCPDSQPPAVEYALRIMHTAGAWDAELVTGACAWLAANEPAEGGAEFVAPSIEGWPHAPWWVPEEGAPPSLAMTGLIAGTLHARGISHPWLARATGLLWSRIDGLATGGPYDLRALLHFLDHVPDRDRAKAAVPRLGEIIIGQGLVTMDPEAPGEIHTPLDFAPLPGSLGRSLFGAETIGAHLDHQARAQQSDGGWMFNWLAWSPAAEREWRGAVTVDALCLLRANGRC